jgi:protein NrfD
MPLPDTLFTAPPHWSWLVILYFYFGGIAGGAYFIAALLGAFGNDEDRALARLGHYIALPAVILCAPLLILDLTRPERFWHMLVQNITFWPMFKYWSPMSVGAWALLLFGAFALVSFVGALVEAGHLRWQPPRVCCTAFFRQAFTILGTFVGFFLASYTGVLLSVTNRVLWADSNFIGALFIFSAASTGAAAMLLFGRQRGVAAGSRRWLVHLDRWVMVAELFVIVVLLISLGATARFWLSIWGLALVIGVVLIGILIPLALEYRPRLLGGATFPAAAGLILLGGLILRAVIVFSAEFL